MADPGTGICTLVYHFIFSCDANCLLFYRDSTHCRIRFLCGRRTKCGFFRDRCDPDLPGDSSTSYLCNDPNDGKDCTRKKDGRFNRYRYFYLPGSFSWAYGYKSVLLGWYYRNLMVRQHGPVPGRGSITWNIRCHLPVLNDKRALSLTCRMVQIFSCTEYLLVNRSTKQKFHRARGSSCSK